jgi:transcriptional regulator with XRE-family HTH domain
MTYRHLNTERVQVAATLRRLREDGGITREEAADVLGCTTSKIGDLETGRSGPKPAEIEKLLERYGVYGEQRTELVEFARAAQKRKPRGTYLSAVVPANLRRALDLEAQAVSSFYYSGELIPGILQVRPYAEAMLGRPRPTNPGEIRTLVELRMARHEHLVRVHRPPLRYRCVLGEGALRTGVGGPEVMAEQVAHLATLNETLPNVVIQILPAGSGSHPFSGTTNTLHSFPYPAPDILATDCHSRDLFHDRPHEVARAAEDFRLLTRKALSQQESTEFLQCVLQQLRSFNRMPRKTDAWFVPARSSNGENCVETKFTGDGVEVRNSVARDSGTATFTHEEWRVFIASVRDGDYDV